MSKRNEDFFLKKKPWSIVKDKLLECYLTPYVAKILNTRKPLLYVDCFAGAGKFTDGNFGSPMIALDIFSERLRDSSASSRTNRFIDANFIELDHSEKLKENLIPYQSTSNLLVSVHAGKYEKRIRQILDSRQGKSNFNLFLYLDPYGFRTLDFNFLTSLPQKNFYSVELLINFNSFGFLRVACKCLKIEFKNDIDFGYLQERDGVEDFSINDATEEMLNRVAGGDYWKELVRHYYRENATFYDLEKTFAEQFCEKLKTRYLYVLNMPIRTRESHSPKYRMIHATNHPDGAILMADNIFRREELLREIQLHGQQTLFGNDSNGDDIKYSLETYLTKIQSFRRLNIVMAEFFTECGVQCESGEFSRIIGRLEHEGKLELIRNPAKTKTGRPSTFCKESKDNTIKLRWKN